jgi:hypothetical protein
MNPADYRAQDRMFLERVQAYAESPGAFRNRWRLRYLRFRRSSWLVAAAFLLPLAWITWRLGDVHLALKGVLSVMALIAVLPLARDFRRSQCRRCEEEAQQARVQKLGGEEFVVSACDHCRVMELRQADSSALPL